MTTHVNSPSHENNTHRGSICIGVQSKDTPEQCTQCRIATSDQWRKLTVGHIRRICTAKKL